MINSTKVNSLKVARFGSMDIVKLRGDTLQPGGQLETPGLVKLNIKKEVRKWVKDKYKQPVDGTKSWYRLIGY